MLGISKRFVSRWERFHCRIN